jgi:hypothetical protein
MNFSQEHLISHAPSVTTFFNPAPGRADMDRSILALCDIICANENEVMEFWGTYPTIASIFEGRIPR